MEEGEIAFQYDERKVIRECITGCIISAVTAEVYTALGVCVSYWGIEKKLRFYDKIEKVVV